MKSNELMRPARIGTYLVSVSVAPSLLIGAPSLAGRATQPGTPAPGVVVSDAGRDLDARLLRASGVLRSLVVQVVEPHEITLLRVPNRVRRMLGLVRRLERPARLPESPEELEAWIGNVGEDA